MSYTNTWTAEDAFARYEELRVRFPEARFPGASLTCSGLREVAEHVDAFVLDSFGVLNVGDTPIAGAVECMAALRHMGKRLIVLTNAASYTRAEAIAKYQRLGFDFTEDEVVSSRDVCTARLAGGRWGAIAADEDVFGDIGAEVVRWSPALHGQIDGVLLLSSAALNEATFAALETALRSRPLRVVVANPDLVAPRETGLSKEPGYYAHLLADRLGIMPEFYGKPFGDAFEDALARLPALPRDRIAMVGDTLHTDILGGAAAGLRTVLMTDHGLYAGLDASRFVDQSGIVPDFLTRSV